MYWIGVWIVLDKTGQPDREGNRRSLAKVLSGLYDGNVYGGFWFCLPVPTDH